ncbi:hypothetical protein NADFUDRAFT_81150 [Nadsonia fulvescens var. elongata DSM 6958]|uniref:Uncharacterized protein n=1 Tax=Nadsonia fulvescens var. elongata DSM 6958 TaxID=857566 RepID=A0A1E3PS11_9ASCO|nr:hypothetical protein NADFUDRAFT_81150 [Nadsonia fulvescens var. elongata DSM 6958]
MTRFLTLKIVGTVSLTAVSGSLLAFSYSTIPSLLALIRPKSTPPTSREGATESLVPTSEKTDSQFKSLLRSNWDRFRLIVYPGTLLSFSCFVISFVLSDKYNRHPYLLYSALSTPLLLLTNYFKNEPLVESILSISSPSSPSIGPSTSPTLAATKPQSESTSAPTGSSQGSPTLLSPVSKQTETKGFKSSLDDSIYQDLGEETFTDDESFSAVDQASPTISSGVNTSLPTPMALEASSQDVSINELYCNQLGKLKRSLNIYSLGLHAFLNVLALIGIFGDN